MKLHGLHTVLGWVLWGNEQLVNSHEASVGVKVNCI